MFPTPEKQVNFQSQDSSCRFVRKAGELISKVKFYQGLDLLVHADGSIVLMDTGVRPRLFVVCG
jgi:hypothetical protein